MHTTVFHQPSLKVMFGILTPSASKNCLKSGSDLNVGWAAIRFTNLQTNSSDKTAILLE